MGDENENNGGAGDGGAGEGGAGAGGAGGGGAPPAGGAAGAGGAGGEQPFAVFQSQEAFEQRLERSTRARLRELGLDPDETKKKLAELEALKAEEAKRREAEMNEIERAQAAAKAAEAEKEAAQAAAKAAQREAEIAKLAAAHRVPDLEYLGFRLAKLEVGTDPDEALRKWLEDPAERVRFGVEAVKPTEGAGGENAEQKRKVATTTATPKSGGNAPQPGAGGTEVGGGKTAMQMTKSEFTAYKREKYGAGSGSGGRKGYKPPPR